MKKLPSVRRTAVLVAATLCASAGTAVADQPAPPPPPPAAPPPLPPSPQELPKPAGADPKLRRDPAHFRGRTNQPTALEGFAWIPRVVFFPLYVVTEYGLRVPLYALAAWADRNHVVPIMRDVFHPTDGIWWHPTIKLDLTTRTMAGVSARWENMGVEGHELKASVSFGGIDAWVITGRDRWRFGPAYAGVRGGYLTRPDRAFYGIGPNAGSFRTNFNLARVDAFAFAGIEPNNHFRLEAAQGYQSDQTGPGDAPSIESRIRLQAVPGFGTEIRLGMTTVELKVDSRRVLEENGGIRLLVNGAYARDTLSWDRAFVTAGMDVEAALEVIHPDRVLTARLKAAEAFALGDEPVPMTQLPTLGGDDHYAFAQGRFRGQSIAMAELSYRYPIAYYVDAQWTASVGNAFGERFQGFDLGAMTGSFGVGIRTRRTGTPTLEMAVGVGTTRFDAATVGVENVRLYFGTTDGL